MVNITYHIPDYPRLIRAEFEPPLRSLISDLQEAQLKVILDRTKNGVDVDEKPFKEYATRTIKAKQKRGLQTYPPNLRHENEMLESMHTTLGIPQGKEDYIQKIIFGTRFDELKALWNNEGTTRIPQREFFGYSDRDIDFYSTLFENTVEILADNF